MTQRILVWCWSHGGGGSQYAVNLAYRLGLRFGRESVALSLAAHDPTIETARGRGVTVRPADVVSNRHRRVGSLIGLPHSAATAREHARDCDVVVAAMNFATLAPIAQALRKPLVYCAHDAEPHAGDYAAIGQRVTQAWLLSRADAIVAPSEYTARRLTKRAALAAKVRVAPLVSVFEPQPLEIASQGPTRFLFAGRIIAYKGLDLLADALALIAHRTDWRLTVAGSGPAMSPSLRARLSHAQVEFDSDGFLSEADMAAHYAACDVVIAPYLQASQSGVVAEALSRGKPCVVTPVGALAEQIGAGDAGWICEDLTPRALAAALERALDADRRRQKTQAAYALALAAWDGDCWDWLAQPIR